MIRTIVADRNYLFRQGIRAVLEKAKDVQVVGEAVDGYEVVCLVKQLQPEVVIMDLSLPGLNGIQVIRKIRELKTVAEIIILSRYTGRVFVKRALAYGAKGYLLKTEENPEILEAVRAVLRGETFLSKVLQGLEVESRREYQICTCARGFDALSLREREVLQLVGEGFNNKEIARQLLISVKTVEKHKANLTGKLDTYNIAGLFRVALKHHLIKIDDCI